MHFSSLHVFLYYLCNSYELDGNFMTGFDDIVCCSGSFDALK